MPDLRFLADMNISPLTVKALRSRGWDIVRVTDVLDAKARDLQILDYARDNDMVLITQDLDFSTLLGLGGHGKPSVISLRLENVTVSLVTNRIVDVVAKLEKELVSGIVVSVDENSARYRGLPLKRF